MTSDGRVRLVSLAIAVVSVALFTIIVAWRREPVVVPLSLGQSRELTEAQEQTIEMIKQLNGYLISLATLMFGGLGFYLTQHRPSLRMPQQTAFFAAACLLVLSFWFATMTYSQVATELAQNLIALVPGRSRVLYYVEMEVTTAGAAAVLLLALFSDTVTRQKGS